MRTALSMLALLLLLISIPARAASIEEAGDEAETLILRKLAEDGAYFKWILNEQKAGRTGDLKADEFQKEVKRAKTLGPVLDYIVDTARKKPDGERIDVAKVRRVAPTTYTQLATYLNLIGAVRSDDFIRAQALAEKIDLEVGFGPTQSIEGYRIALTRHYYYLRSQALYHLHEDEKAVQWFGQIDADAEVKAMNLPRKKEIETLRLADLNQRPIAVTAFAPTDENAEEQWIGLAVSDGVVNDLVNHTDLQVVERTRLNSVMEELSLGLMGVVDEKHAVELGKMLEAGTLVYGSYTVKDDVVTLSGRLVHVESGAVLQSAIVRGKVDKLYDTTRELTTELLGDAGLVSARQKLKIIGARAPSDSAVRAVAKARLQAASNPEAAKELFEEAMNSDPQYANAHDVLRAQFADVSAKVGILPLRNTTGNDADAWLSDGIAELLGRDLPVLGFSTVERSEMRRVMAYQLALMGAEDASGQAALADGAMDLAAMGEQIAANFLLVGGFQHLGDDLKINVRFVDIGSGEVLYTAGAEGKMKDYGKVVSDVIAALAEDVGRDLDAEALDKLVEGKPTLEEFEKFMRGEIAKDTLTAEEATAEAEKEKEAEEAEKRELLAAQLQERIDAASAGKRTRTFIAAGVGGAGLAMAGVGIGMGHADRQKAGEFLALANNAIRQEDADSNLEKSKSFHNRAVAWQVVGYSGIGLAVGGAALMALGGKAKPDLEGLELSAGVTPLPRGGGAWVGMRW